MIIRAGKKGAIKVGETPNQVEVYLVSTYSCTFDLDRDQMLKLKEWLTLQLEALEDG